jgi:hypothetical protein
MLLQFNLKPVAASMFFESLHQSPEKDKGCLQLKGKNVIPG